jgi:hypothetical protein
MHLILQARASFGGLLFESHESKERFMVVLGILRRTHVAQCLAAIKLRFYSRAPLLQSLTYSTRHFRSTLVFSEL